MEGKDDKESEEVDFRRIGILGLLPDPGNEALRVLLTYQERLSSPNCLEKSCNK